MASREKTRVWLSKWDTRPKNEKGRNGFTFFFSETTEHPPVTYGLRHIERLKEGTSPQIIERMNAVKGTIGDATLVLDVTGVGRATVELFRRARLYFPKRDLVSAAQVMLQTGRLKIANGLPHAKLLLRELQRFRVRFDPTHGNDYLAWREGPQDDMASMADFGNYTVTSTCIAPSPPYAVTISADTAAPAVSAPTSTTLTQTLCQ